jgi:hypothetical protein
MSRWEFGSRTDFEAVLRLEFAADVADAWLAGHPDTMGLSYGYVLFAVTRGPDPGPHPSLATGPGSPLR